MDRELNRAEVATVNWLLDHANPGEQCASRRRSVGSLRVRGHCDCGCASVDFCEGGLAEGSKPIAEGLGEDSSGEPVGLILWGTEDAITGLEIYEMGGGVISELPPLERLSEWGST